MVSEEQLRALLVQSSYVSEIAWPIAIAHSKPMFFSELWRGLNPTQIERGSQYSKTLFVSVYRLYNLDSS
jgi:hypothetical protein